MDKKNVIVYFTPKKYNLNVIPIGAIPAGLSGGQTTGRESEVEESIELIKISSRRTGTRNDSFTKYNINNMLL
jgi:hypothetical protein